MVVYIANKEFSEYNVVVFDSMGVQHTRYHVPLIKRPTLREIERGYFITDANTPTT